MNEHTEAQIRTITAFNNLGIALPIHNKDQLAITAKLFGDELADTIALLPQMFNDLARYCLKHEDAFVQYLNMIELNIKYIRGEIKCPKMTGYLKRLEDAAEKDYTQERYESEIRAGALKLIKQWGLHHAKH